MSIGGSAAKSLVVLTVDDHPLIRSALRELIGLMAERVELLEAANPPDGLAMLERRADTDLVLLDLNFAAHDGLAFIERFRAAAPATPVLVYTMHEDAATLRQALALGAVGIVPKTHSAKLLQKAIELVMDGGIYLPPELARQLASPEAAPAARPASRAMSEQQWKILELLAQGFPNKAIARELGIAPSTVKNQLTVVFDKLGVSNRTQAAIAARALIKSKPPGH
ncbi:MAG TPA: response regulator transcription factor [Burkholderiales bacterium]|jgi:DNA-binding NarL/FixJ family response regulator